MTEVLHNQQEAVLFEHEDRVAQVIINRPEVHNAVDLAAIDSLTAAVKRAVDEKARALVLCGAGPSFCTGGDVRHFDPDEPGIDTVEQMTRSVGTLIRTVAEAPIPVIAAVHGYAIGAGWAIVLACDLVVAEEDATFRAGFARAALTPDTGLTYWLPRVVGPHRAKDLVFRDRRISGTEAHGLGLVTTLAPPGKAGDVALDLARDLAAGPTRTLGWTKTLFSRAWNANLDTTIEYEFLAQTAIRSSTDFQEAIRALQARETPSFGGL